MTRTCAVEYRSLRSSLVNLPISLYGPLLQRGQRPQSVAVHLKSTKQKPAEVYVGWTGLASASSLAHFNSASGEGRLETVEIDPQYAQSVGLYKGAVVEIGLLYDLPSADTVVAEPVTADDWEIIELHAAHLESTLLSQVRVAAVGQEMDVWVHGRTRVRLSVVSLIPPRTTPALLTSSTQLSIAPKPRSTKQPPSSASKQPSTAPPTTTAFSSPPKPKAPPSATSSSNLTLRVLPARLVPDLPSPAEPKPVMYVSPWTFATLSGQPWPFPPDQSAMTKFFVATYRRGKAPVDPTAPPPAAEPQAKVLKPTEVSEGKEEGKGSERREVVLTYWNDIVDMHVVLVGGEEEMGVDEWDLVRLTLISPYAPSSHPPPPPPVFNTHLRPPPPFDRARIAPHLSGIDALLKRLVDWCINTYLLHLDVDVVRGVSTLLLTGRSGFGKTAIAKAVAHAIQSDPRTYAYTLYVDAARYAALPVASLKALFKFWYAKAAWHRPAVLVLDNLDKLLPAELEHADPTRTRHLTELFLHFYGRSSRFAAPDTARVLCVATAESQSALHALLSQMHVFADVVEITPPDKDARREILAAQVQRRFASAGDLREDAEAPLNYTVLATQTEGYSPVDLADLVARAVHQALIRAGATADAAQVTLVHADFDAAQVDFTPLSLRDIKLQKSDVAWADIGGLRETKRVLRETIEWPTKYAPIFAQSPLRLRSGLLLYGYPGCGKTLLASAVARECGLNFISVKGPELLNKYIGASEKSVRDLFDRASAAKPCVLFFDEFDSIAPKRGHDSTGVTDRVVNQMLTQLDGVEGLTGVYVLAATSRPDMIDPALLRPGRLDKALLCDMPDMEDRRDILGAVSRKVTVAPSVDWDEIACETEGFSGADLQALVYNAHLDVVHSNIPNGVASRVGGDACNDEVELEYTVLGGAATTKVVSKAEEAAMKRRLRQIVAEKSHQEIQMEHLLRALKTTRPSVSDEERGRLHRIYQAFTLDRSGDLPVPPDAGGVGQRVSLM
ncbi:AAA-domain-containing protein [Gloeophyllum trabeum ATCC 11539]|uniref:Peroxisomal ATPase PEX1 n=1 Tax=Gloeophyllum trabeum (strain ATCC 11539 / FP-39264 / Madison 617) TaxID=670483 RepID=S7Q667_GLOTA|nr:AAA-domain-containing protein [Gloeophyllum trabeum ATCC 11539]EPQ54978.1 AAA-domain-containing protein [Gloeophyllum trabeum ATCC 11539]